jgi:hypothetical protein
VISRDTFKMLAGAAIAVLAYQFVRSEVVLLALVPVGGFLGVWLYGVVERLHNWRIMKFMADLLPDGLAKVERK